MNTAFPVDLLNKLFAPSTSYVDLATRLHCHDSGRHDYGAMAEEALDLLKFDVDDAALAEGYSPKTQNLVTIDSDSQKMMGDAFKSLGDTIVGNREEIHNGLRSALFFEMEELLAPLDAPGMKEVREKLDVQAQWMEAVGAVGAFADLMEFGQAKRSVAWWSWFLRGAGTPALLGEEGAEAAVLRLSRRQLEPGRPSYPDEYSEPWVDWALQGNKWKDTGTFHGMWLASTLADPQKRLAEQMDARGFKFSMDRVSWTVAIAHSNHIPDKDLLTCKEVERFLVNHMATIVALDPAWARNPHQTNMEKRWWFKQGAKNITNGRGLQGLLENVIDLDLRREMLCDLDRCLMDHATSPATGLRAAPRL